MEVQSETILTKYAEHEKVAYLGALAGLSTADREASNEEVEQLREIAHAAGQAMVTIISVQSTVSVSIVATRKILPCFVHPVHTTHSNGLRLMGNTSPPFFCQVPTSAGPLSMEEIFIPEYVGHGCVT